MYIFLEANKHWTDSLCVCVCNYQHLGFSSGSCRSSLISASGGRVIYREPSPFVKVTHCRSLEEYAPDRVFTHTYAFVAEDRLCLCTSSTWTDPHPLLRFSVRHVIEKHRTRWLQRPWCSMSRIDVLIHKLSFLRMLWDINHHSHAGVPQTSGSP